jgi:hypothetical protein
MTHLTDIEIAAYVDRNLPTADLDRVEDHLAGCAECRGHVLETKQLLRRVRKPRRVIAGASVAAAAAILLVFLTWPGNGPEQLTAPAATLRDGGSESRLLAYGPSGETARAGLQFVWGSAPNAASYRITLSRSDGNTLWSASSSDTVAVPPAGVGLHSGEHYFWIVDAIIKDGSTRSTGMREFEVVE